MNRKNYPHKTEGQSRREVRYVQVKLIERKYISRNFKGIIFYGKSITKDRVEGLIKARMRSML